jgi:hypothetical protein
MRTLTFALALLTAPVGLLADSTKDFLNNPGLQMALIFNVRNPEMRQQISSSLAKHPGSVEKLNRYMSSIAQIVIIQIEDKGNKIALVIAKGNFDKNARMMLKQDGVPSQLVEEDSVCFAISINGRDLSPSELQQFGSAMNSKNNNKKNGNNGQGLTAAQSLIGDADVPNSSGNTKTAAELLFGDADAPVNSNGNTKTAAELLFGDADVPPNSTVNNNNGANSVNKNKKKGR